MPLPFFLLFSSNIYDQILLFNKSPAFGPPVDLPILWVYLLVNTLSQYICIRSVFVMTSEYTSLTVTMILTLRKFFSLVFSVFYFQNQFTSTHWFGTMLIFIGTFIFIDVWKSKEKPKEKLKENRKPKEWLKV